MFKEEEKPKYARPAAEATRTRPQPAPPPGTCSGRGRARPAAPRRIPPWLFPAPAGPPGSGPGAAPVASGSAGFEPDRTRGWHQ